uniref:SGNH hydrolase-type esterase domain-containing protein n=1 Tax=Astyanax mexicanus TaxID=7994 RepID=A0A3B1JED7_ASTMX
MPPCVGSEHLCCQNCYNLLQRMTVLETNFRSLLSEFKDWHFCASGQWAGILTEQRAVETNRTGPADHVDIPNVSTAERYGQNQQWVRIGAKPKRHATYSSVVSSTPANIAHLANANAKAIARRSEHRARGNQFQSLSLQNRFEPLQDLNDFPNTSQYDTERTRRFSHSKHPRRATGLQAVATADTLVLGDDSVHGMNNNQKLIVRCEPNITVSELNEKLPALLAEYRTVKRIIVHVGKNDTRKEESVLKRDFNDLFTNIQTFISGPLPARGCNMFSRLLALNIWLQKTCRSNGLNFIDNFNLFFGKREFFRRDGLHTNKRGVKFLSENFIFSLCNFSVPTGEDTSALTPNQSCFILILVFISIFTVNLLQVFFLFFFNFSVYFLICKAL